ncbi:MAG: hypothetical protein ACQEQF_11770 [Bacillota bacterium]
MTSDRNNNLIPDIEKETQLLAILIIYTDSDLAIKYIANRKISVKMIQKIR